MTVDTPSRSIRPVGANGVSDITFDVRHQGPFGSVNGGYVAGLLGDAAGGATSSVRLHKPVPLDRGLRILAGDGRAALLNGDETLAAANNPPDHVTATTLVTLEEATAADDFQLDMGIFADCFVCGRSENDGLGVRPRPLGDGRFAAVWHPGSSGLIDGRRVPARYLRAALDCPGGFAAIGASGKLAVTGSLTSRVNFLPDSNEPLVVVGEAAGEEGRKLAAITTIFNESQEIVATAEAIWVTLATLPAEPAG